MNKESDKKVRIKVRLSEEENEKLKNKNKWLIDEEAAQTVRYIFKLCYDGLGPTQIAKKLKAEKVLTPTAYKAQKDGKLLPAEPYKWAQKTVAGILEKLDISGIPKTSRRPLRITAAKSVCGTTRKTAGYLRIPTLPL